MENKKNIKRKLIMYFISYFLIILLCTLIINITHRYPIIIAFLRIFLFYGVFFLIISPIIMWILLKKNVRKRYEIMVATFIGILLIISSCYNCIGGGNISLGELIENPGIYYEKVVITEGYTTDYDDDSELFFLGDYSNYFIYISKKPYIEYGEYNDTDIFPIRVNANMNIRYGSKYQFTGIINCIIINDPLNIETLYYLDVFEVQTIEENLFSFVPDYDNNKIILAQDPNGMFDSSFYWEDFEIRGECNSTNLGLKMNLGDEITNCSGTIDIRFIPVSWLYGPYEFS